MHARRGRTPYGRLNVGLTTPAPTSGPCTPAWHASRRPRNEVSRLLAEAPKVVVIFSPKTPVIPALSRDLAGFDEVVKSAGFKPRRKKRKSSTADRSRLLPPPRVVAVRNAST